MTNNAAIYINTLVQVFFDSCFKGLRARYTRMMVSLDGRHITNCNRDRRNCHIHPHFLSVLHFALSWLWSFSTVCEGTCVNAYVIRGCNGCIALAYIINMLIRMDFPSHIHCVHARANQNTIRVFIETLKWLYSDHSHEEGAVYNTVLNTLHNSRVVNLTIACMLNLDMLCRLSGACCDVYMRAHSIWREHNSHAPLCERDAAVIEPISPPVSGSKSAHKEILPNWSHARMYIMAIHTCAMCVLCIKCEDEWISWVLLPYVMHQAARNSERTCSRLTRKLIHM